MKMDAEEIKSVVKKRYGSLAKGKNSSCCTPESVAPTNCCGTGTASCQSPALAGKLYTSGELDKLPPNVTDISLGCGNPAAIAELSEGEVVLDLGSGGGIDCFLAARKVGKQGRVIGLDMTPEMIQLARENAQRIGAGNVEFRLGEMEQMPVEDNSIDVIISNCVINLSPDKDAVFREIFRVLKPGGRLCISDIVLLEKLPEEVEESLDHWTSCIAGAIIEMIYLGKIRAAGFVEVAAEKSAVPFCPEGETSHPPNANIPKTHLDLKSKVASIRVKAFKPDR